MTKADVKAEYAAMLMHTEFPHCWWCGRGVEHKPDSWFAPWLIERAHIVSSPRVEDRRAVVLLCSMCHRVSHGEQLVLPSMEKLVVPQVSHMVWLKKRFDHSHYDRAFLNSLSIAMLPRAKAPQKEVLDNYASRRQDMRLKSPYSIRSNNA
jgi:hypothetical protein